MSRLVCPCAALGLPREDMLLGGSAVYCSSGRRGWKEDMWTNRKSKGATEIRPTFARIGVWAPRHSPRAPGRSGSAPGFWNMLAALFAGHSTQRSPPRPPTAAPSATTNGDLDAFPTPATPILTGPEPDASLMLTTISERAYFLPLQSPASPDESAATIAKGVSTGYSQYTYAIWV